MTDKAMSRSPQKLVSEPVISLVFKNCVCVCECMCVSTCACLGSYVRSLLLLPLFLLIFPFLHNDSRLQRVRLLRALGFYQQIFFLGKKRISH